MIVGDGLIARAMKKYDSNDEIIIFASGVSNSSEISPKEFEREKILLSEYIGQKERLVYFSTCSIFDKSLSQSKYVLHKINMEKFITHHFENYIIFRLPTIVADSSNPNTLINFLLDKIKNGQVIRVYKKACRYLLDINVMSYLLPFIIDNDIYNKQIINIAFDKPIKIIEIIKTFETTLNIKANIKLIDKGHCFSIDNEIFKNFIHKIDYKLSASYNYDCIKRFCRKVLA